MQTCSLTFHLQWRSAAHSHSHTSGSWSGHFSSYVRYKGRYITQIHKNTHTKRAEWESEASPWETSAKKKGVRFHTVARAIDHVVHTHINILKNIQIQAVTTPTVLLNLNLYWEIRLYGQVNFWPKTISKQGLISFFHISPSYSAEGVSSLTQLRQHPLSVSGFGYWQHLGKSRPKTLLCYTLNLCPSLEVSFCLYLFLLTKLNMQIVFFSSIIFWRNCLPNT